MTSPSAQRILLLTVLLGCGLAWASGPSETSQPDAGARVLPAPPRQKTAPWTIDDVILAPEAGSFDIAPDCRWIVWIKKVADREKDSRVGHLFLSSLTDRQERQLTHGRDCTEPRWSPDSRHVAFLAAPAASADKTKARDEKGIQLHLLDPFGGNPRALTTSSTDVLHFQWASPETIVYSSRAKGSKPSDEEDSADDTIVVEDEEHEPPVQLFALTVATKQVRRLTDNRDRIESFALAPGGRWAVTAHQRSLRSTFDNKVKPAYFLYDLASGTRRPVFTEPHFKLERIVWAADGTSFYAINARSGDPHYFMAGVSEVYQFDLAAGTPRRVGLDWSRGLSRQWDDDRPALEATPDGFLALLADGARNVPARYTRQGNAWKRELLVGPHDTQLFGLVIGRDGRTLLYATTTASTPTHWYRAVLEGSRFDTPVLLTGLGGHFRGKTIARTELVRWKGARDEEVEGLLYYPHDYRPGRKYPLVVIVHGGPDIVDYDGWDESWSHPNNLLAQRGAFVFRPNYHGSSNYGLAWATSICCGRYYNLEIPDIEKGVDALIARGLVDPRRLAAMGRSNGAILTTALTVQTDRYRAASVMAGTVEQASDWGATEFGAAFDHFYLGASPFEDPALYVRKSPFYRLGRVRTPTLILFGSEDRIVSPHQGYLHFRALQHFGKAPVRFLLFPGEGHDLEGLVHQRRKLREELAWLDRYLFNQAAPGR